MRETHNLQVADGIRDVSESPLIGGLFLLFPIVFIELLFVVFSLVIAKCSLASEKNTLIFFFKLMFFLRGFMKDIERKAKAKTYSTVIPRIAPIIN